MRKTFLSKQLHIYITKILTVRPDLRDSDDRLIAHIWSKEAIEHGIVLTAITGLTLLKFIRDGYFTNSESIRRSRQKVQEENPVTRGEKYLARHVKASAVRSVIGKNKF